MAAPPNVVAHKPHFHRNEAWKQPVRCATTAAGTLATSFANGQTVDGVALVTGDRILVKDQAAGAENGIYVVAASGAPARAFDMDVAAEVVGAQVYVVAGTVNAGLVFRSTNTTTPTLETTALSFALPTGSALTVSDEGTPLATAATTLDFVGAGVVASGTGATKTITISGGGSGVTVEEVDGTPTVTATKLVLPNGTLGVVGSVATYTPAAGSLPAAKAWLSGNDANEDIPASPDATYDDEFDDTTGMSGAVNGLDARWNWRNQGTATATFGTQGYLSLNAPAQSSSNFRIIEIAALADGTYEALISLEGAQALGAGKGEHGGIVTIDATNGDFYLFGFIKDNATVYFGLQKWTNVTTYSANTALRTLGTNVIPPPLYVRYVKAGTVSTWYASLDGIAWTQVYTEATDGVVPTRIGLAVNEMTNTGATKLLVDYFRKTA